MPKGAAAVPDAWDDDDWEAQADRIAKEEPKPPSPKPVLTKAERQAEHQASNRKLWQEASEVKETLHFVEATKTVPLSTGFKPQVKVLSRKPVIAKRDPASGMAHLNIDDDDDALSKEPTLSAEEIRAKQKKDREEKQRRYDEARAKIFGESAPSSRGSSPGIGGTTTPPRQDSRRGARGGARAGSRGGGYQQQQQQQQQQPIEAQARSAGPRELYDPNYSSRDSSQRRHDDANTRQKDEGAPIRAPRGPDASGRGGFGFARRGGT